MNWTNPLVPVTGDVAYIGTYIVGACTAYARVTSLTGPVATMYNFTGLTSNQNYCASVVDYNGTIYSAMSIPVFIFLANNTGATPLAITVVLGNVTGQGGNAYQASAIWTSYYAAPFVGTIYLTGSWFTRASNVTVFINGAPVNSYDGGSNQVVTSGQVSVANGSSIAILVKYDANPVFSFTSPVVILNNYGLTIALLIVLSGIVIAALVAFSGVTGRRRDWLNNFVGVLLLTGLVGTWVAIG